MVSRRKLVHRVYTSVGLIVRVSVFLCCFEAFGF